MKHIFLLGLSLFLTQHIIAQSLKGRVQDKQSGKAVEGATVQIKGSNNGAITDGDGTFRINVSKEGNYILEVRSVGYKSTQKKVNSSNPEILILLEQENISLLAVDIYEDKSFVAQEKIMKEPMKELSSIAQSISVVGEEQILKQGSTNLMEAIKYVPGAWTETRGRKVKQFVSVRGQKYPYPEFSLNNIWQNEFEESSYFMSSANIESIEVIRSSAALLNSLSGLTGVINVKTKEYEEQQTDAHLKYGSFNRMHSSVTHGGKYNNLSYSAGVAYDGTDGPDGRHGKENMGNAFANFKYHLNDHWTFSGNVMYLYGKRQLVQPVAPADPKFNNWFEEYDPVRSLITSAKVEWRPNDKYSTELHVNYADRNHTYRRYDQKKDTRSTNDEKDHEIGINLIQAIALSNDNTLRAGVIYNHWKAPNGKRFYYGNECDVHTVSAVVTDQHTFGKLTLDVGLRQISEYYKKYGAFNINGSAGKFRGVAPIEDQWQPVQFQSTAGASYEVTRNNSFHFNFAGGNVAPRNGALTDEGERPETETRLNYELACKQRFSKGGQIVVTGFFTDRKDAIAYSGKTVELDNDDLMETYINLPKRNYGVELAVQSPQLWNCISGFYNFTWMKADEKTDNAWDKDPEIPNVITNLGILFEKQGWDANLFANYVGDYTSTRFAPKGSDPVELGDFCSLDATAGYTFGKRSTLRTYVEVKNITDNTYSTVVGYPDFGRRIGIGVKMSINR